MFIASSGYLTQSSSTGYYKTFIRLSQNYRDGFIPFEVSSLSTLFLGLLLAVKRHTYIHKFLTMFKHILHLLVLT